MKNTANKIIPAIILTLALSSCSSTASKDKNESNPKTVISTYKGGKITFEEASAELNKVIVKNDKLRGITFTDLSKEQKELIIKEAVLKEISLKEAKKNKLHKAEDYKTAVKIFKEELLKQKFYSYLQTEASAEEKVKTHYDELVEKLTGKQDLRIRYILLDKEEVAVKLVKKLTKSPQFFQYQAKKKSLDKETAEKGGDLGYVLETQLPAQVVEAAKTLKKGQVYDSPIALNNQWVVLKLEDIRDTEISKFEDVKVALGNSLAQQAVKDFVSAKLEKAKINITD